MPEENERPDAGDDLREVLKHSLPSSRLPPELRAQILAELPSPEEQERLYRELQEEGGLSSEKFLASLGLADDPRP